MKVFTNKRKPLLINKDLLRKILKKKKIELK